MGIDSVNNPGINGINLNNGGGVNKNPSLEISQKAGKTGEIAKADNIQETSKPMGIFGNIRSVSGNAFLKNNISMKPNMKEESLENRKC
jgi:hypothetical protein